MGDAIQQLFRTFPSSLIRRAESADDWYPSCPRALLAQQAGNLLVDAAAAGKAPSEVILGDTKGGDDAFVVVVLVSVQVTLVLSAL